MVLKFAVQTLPEEENAEDEDADAEEDEDADADAAEKGRPLLLKMVQSYSGLGGISRCILVSVVDAIISLHPLDTDKSLPLLSLGF